MLQLSIIKENIDSVISGLTKKYYKTPEADVNAIIVLDKNRRETQQELDTTLAETNVKAKEIGVLMKAGKTEAVDELKKITATLKDKAKQLSESLNLIESELQDLLIKLPNLPHDTVPVGRTPEENEVVFEYGKIPKLHDDALPHWELIKKYDIIDFELGNKITGAGFPVYKGYGARLQRGLINFFLEHAIDAGYTEIQPPILVNAESGFGTGQLPDKEGQMYHATADNLYLIPTAEVPITNLYRDVIIKEENLPIKNVGYTPCFRREAGSWGADVRGLNRLHQFDKVEIVQISHPDDSYKILDEMVTYVQGLLEKLDLPYRILRLCGGDMSFSSALTFDFEVYSAAQQRWLEVSSVSNFEAFQANRLKLRGKGSLRPYLLHTLNGSALALPRIVAALLENNQYDGGIKMPKALIPYVGFDAI
ncbi:MAG TPA: serine--tRNA ligase [Cytophagaceae bacterium]|jgi:seryl-tRNA synthetase